MRIFTMCALCIRLCKMPDCAPRVTARWISSVELSGPEDELACSPNSNGMPEPSPAASAPARRVRIVRGDRPGIVALTAYVEDAVVGRAVTA